MKKKIIFQLCFLFLTLQLFGKNIGILSFNINGTINGNHNVNNKVWVNQIKAIIIQAAPDIVLLQEFPIKNHDKTFVNLILDGLGARDWSYYCTDEYIKPGEKANQNNIVFYNTKVILPAQFANEVINFKEKNPSYHFVKNNYQVIHFCLKDEQTKDFILINVHTPFDTKTEYVKYYADMNELKLMYNSLKQRFQRIIMAGDFNTYRFMMLNEYFPEEYVDGNSKKYFFTYGSQEQGLLTTLKKRSLSNQIALANDYDHFVIYGFKVLQEMKHSFYQGNDYGNDYYHKIKLGEKYYTSNQDIMKDVSDHLPVFIELDL